MIVLIDVDGTLSDPTHRRDHLKNRDWDSFFSEMDKDPPKREYCALASMLLASRYRVEGTVSSKLFGARNTLEVIFVTGRPEDYREKTEQWLTKYVGLYPQEYKYIYMRASGDTRADYVVKEELHNKILEDFPNHTVKLVIDDRPSVVDMWKRKGYPVIVAPGWDREGFERPRVPTLHMMVGPTGAGKTYYIQSRSDWDRDMLVSSDRMREQLLGNWRDNTKNDLVFHAVHDQIKSRLSLGLDTIFEATNLRNRDRRAVLDKIPEDVRVVYHVINRPMEEKKRDDTWRKDVIVKDKPIMEYHEHTFNSNLKDILCGDNDSRVTVLDLRRV